MPFINPRLLRIGIASVFLAMSAALAAQTLPEPVSRDGVLYMTGGIGEDDAKAFRALAPRYSLRMTLTAPAGNYLSDVDVTIASASGHAILDTRTEGPFLFVMLPAGRYRIVAHAGRTAFAKTVDVPRRGGLDLHVVLQERSAGDAQMNCPHCRASMHSQSEP
ncbi:carboxypeptidase-like regulatory domain-containing protein [Paraburkholderia xenovorans]|jgi:hypothetical protein